MRSMSFMLTTQQILNQTKTITRRLGWKSLEVGDWVQAVEKGQGLKKGERMKRLALIEIVSIRKERLAQIGYPVVYPDPKSELAREGFPDMTPDQFIAMFLESMGGEPDQFVRRIEFRYVDMVKENPIYVLMTNPPRKDSRPRLATFDKAKADEWKSKGEGRCHYQVKML